MKIKCTKFFAKAYSNSSLAVFIETAMKIKCTIFWLKHIAIALAVLIETAMKIKCTNYYFFAKAYSNIAVLLSL
jgi:hypothetical protein